jgi:DNA-3-methyladenine glycosylase II
VAGDEVVLRLAGPLDVPGSLEGYRRSGDDLLDRWDGAVWLRALRLDRGPVAVAARPVGTVAAPALLVAAGEGAGAAAGRALAGAFVTAHAALRELAAADPVVAALAARWPGVGPVLQPDLLTAVVRSISAQQITLRFAAVLRSRLARRFGRHHTVPLPRAPAGADPAAGPGGPAASARPAAAEPATTPAGDPAATPAGEGVGEVWSLDAAALAGADVGELRALQFSNAKAVAVVSFAGAVAAGRVRLDELRALADEQVVERLVAYPGIGRWTAEWLLARTLGRPRVVAGDLGVRKAVGAAYLGGRMPSEAEVRAATAHWGAAAGVAQQLLLHRLAEETATRRPGRRSLPAGARPGQRGRHPEADQHPAGDQA